MSWLLLLCSVSVASFVPKPAESGGVVEARVSGDGDGSVETVRLPLTQTAVEAWIDGDLATVKMTQTFHNPLTEATQAAYLFPLPPDAAVYRMRFTVGDEVIEGQIRRKEVAEAEFQAAKDEGKAAALLTQSRPNLFVQQLANLMPDQTVTVELEYAHPVPRIDGAYTFHFPMHVADRYIPSEASRQPQPGEPEPLELGQWNIPASGDHEPEMVPPGQVSLSVHLDAGLPLRRVESPSHPVATTQQADGEQLIVLKTDAAVPNEDFLLTYATQGETVAVGTTAFADAEQRIVSLLVEPPAVPPEALVSPREMVFLLDCSGSMSGEPIEASKRFMRAALQNLRETDTFRIYRFSESASSLAAEALPATPDNIARGLQYVDGLEGTGGTQMIEGIRAALGPPKAEGRMRIVTFLTDGHIGNEADIIRLVEQKGQGARLFAFGIGGSVNRYLLQSVARAGRGVARFVADGETADAAAERLAERLKTPILTDVSVDWGDAPVASPTPAVAPDLFAGEPLRILAAVEQPGTYTVTVRGTLGGQPAALPVQVTVPAQDTEARALPVVWARSLIEDRMIDYMSVSTDASRREALREEIVQLGLEHRLVTQWTAFVAVSNRVVNPDAAEKNKQAAWSSPSAAGAPEPQTWVAIIALMSLGLMVLYRRG